MECSGARSLYWRSLTAGAATWSVPYCLYTRVCSPERPNTLVAYIAGGTLCHQPMGVGHMTVLQLRRPMGFCVLQWYHPMLVQAKRKSYCTRMITLYGARKWIQARADVNAMGVGPQDCCLQRCLSAILFRRGWFPCDHYPWWYGTYPRLTPIVMTSSGGHQNRYSWQAGSTHATGILSC